MTSVLTLSAFYLNLFAVFLYFFLHLLIFNIASGEVCQIDNSLPKWANIWLFAEITGFYSSLILNVIRILNLSDNNYKTNLIAIYSTVIAINFMAGTSSLIQYAFPWTRICSDKFEYFLTFMK